MVRMRLDCPALKTSAWNLPLSRSGNTIQGSPSKKNISVSNAILRRAKASSKCFVVKLSMLCKVNQLSTSGRIQFCHLRVTTCQPSVQTAHWDSACPSSMSALLTAADTSQCPPQRQHCEGQICHSAAVQTAEFCYWPLPKCRGESHGWCLKSSYHLSVLAQV